MVETELEALLLEAFYIKRFKPKYNIRLVDNKSYLYIRITIKDKYPLILLSRREDDASSFYFGPYPNARAVRLVLKILRRVFPYQSVLNHPKRVCLYHHLGLCPCPPMFDSEELKKNYRRNIKSIIRVLEGESKKLMAEFEKERDAVSTEEKFEEALQIQKKIDALSLITRPFHKPFEYDINPNLRSDLRSRELEDLKNILNGQGYAITRLQRIECYDISNTQGTNATASMVVFTDGEKDSSQYRKFKMRKDGTPNDFAMMKEVLTRRLKHTDWQYPDLIIVDGGKGQVSSAMEVLLKTNTKIPLIGLAKREETIVLPENIQYQLSNIEAKSNKENINTNFTEISLPKNTKALHLIMRLRDEAHRFAITYHRKLRSKIALA